MSQIKTVLITGASSGFGLTACESFLSEGWQVLAAVRGGASRAPLFAKLSAEHGARFQIFELDLTDGASIDRLGLEIAGQGTLDGLINNAGYGLFGSTEDMTEVSLRRQMEVNFFGTVRLTQKLLPLLRSSRGVILTVSSVLGRHAFPLTGGYCASKFAVEGWMESLAAEVKPYGISAYILEPGAFPTGFGTSLDWAKPLENSPYIKSSEGYERLRLKISKRNKNKKLEPVGQKMVKLLTRRPSSLRHPIGSDAVATMIFARLLPTNLYARIIGSLMNRLQRIHAS